MLLDINPKLTGFESPGMQRAARTHAGMAHFAGTGPDGLTCRECRFWRQTREWTKQQPKATSCAKYNELTMTHAWGPRIPHNALACKHFVASDSPQPLTRPDRG